MAAETILKGGVILYPTDTVWGLGCDATRAKVVRKIFKIKNRHETKSLIILVDSIERIKKHIDKENKIIFDLVKGFDQPTTIIYPGARNLAKNVIAPDGTIAIRLVKHPFCEALINKIDRPIVSTSANVAGMQTPVLFSQVEDVIKNQVDYVVDWEQEVIRSVKPSTILKVEKNGLYSVIRP